MGEPPIEQRSTSCSIAAALLRSGADIDARNRELIARMIESLDQLYIEALMVEQAHSGQKHPYYSKGLTMAKAILLA